MAKRAKELLLIILMSLLNALNYEIFVFPNQFAPAGINGLATMVQYKLGFSVGYMNLLIVLPLCIAAFFIVDRELGLKTMLYALLFSGFLLLFRNHIIDLTAFLYHTDNGNSTILAPVAAGVVNGFIYGVTLKQNCFTGGSDLIAGIFRHYHPEKSLMWVIFALNCSVAFLSFFVYGYQYEPVLCCIIYSYLTSKVSDMMLQGAKAQVKFEIVTKHPRELSQEIIQKLHHSATVLQAHGMYSDTDTYMMVCVINKYQIVRLQEILSHYPGSFAYIGAVSEVFGNFRSKEELARRYHERVL